MPTLGMSQTLTAFEALMGARFLSAQRQHRVDAKPATPARRPPDARAVIGAGLIHAGGNYMNDAVIEAVVSVSQAQASANGGNLDTEEARNRLAVNSEALAKAVEETKLQLPDEFIDVSKLDRLPEERRLIAKMKEVARVFGNRKIADRLVQKILTGKMGNQHRPI